MKKLNLLILSILCCLPTVILAAGKDTDSYIECWYNDSKIYYYYNVTTNEFVFQGKYISRHTYSSDLISSNFIDKKTNSLKCPTIYATTKSNSAGANTHIQMTKQGNNSFKYEPEKINSKNEKLTTIKTCVYSSGKHKVEFVLDTNKKSIVSSKVNGMDASSNEFKYDEILINSKCVDIEEIYGSCYDGSHGGSSVCNISKKNPNTGFSSGTTLDHETSTGADEKPDNNTNNEFVGGEEVYGCQVIPDEIRNWIKDALNLLKYVALVLVIVLGVLDFIKAAGSGEAEAMKKAGQDFLKRIIAVIILFLLPYIVDLILNLIEIAGADSTCLPQ